MRVVVQRSLDSSVMVSSDIVGKIDRGLVLLVGFTHDDTLDDIEYMVKKILNLRIFEDDDGKMNLSVLDIGGSILSISQFTLYADLKKGNRPSFVQAMKADRAKELYQVFNEKLSQYIHVETGVFGADMKLSICNEGPVTILLESWNKNDKKSN